MYSRILAPIDGSATSERGLQEAIALAKDQKATLCLLNVLDANFIAMDPSGMIGMVDFLDSMRAFGAKLLADSKAKALAQGVVAETVQVEPFSGRVGQSISDYAGTWPADLIVMGTHGRRGINRMLMGSDAEIVARTSPVSVLLVRVAQTDQK